MDPSPSTLLNRGIAAHRAGNRAEARDLVVKALIADQESELGWIWFATVASDRGEQRYAIDRALKINPESAARLRLRRLQRTRPVVPPEFVELEPPALPPDLQAAPAGITDRLPLRPIRRRRPSDAEPDPLASPAAQPLPTMAAAEVAPVTDPTVIDPAADPAVTDRGVGVAAPPDDAPPRRAIWGWLAAAAVLVVLAGLVVVLQDEDRDTYHVAVIAPLSGPLAAIGQEEARAAEMAVDEINADGGVAGRDLELVVVDDGNSPDVARQRAETIADDDDVLVVVGHYGSEAALAGGEIYGPAGLPVISPSAAAAEVTAGKPWSFSVVVPGSTQGAFVARYVRDVLGLDNASIVVGPGPFFAGAQASFDAEMRAGGGTVEHVWTVDPNNLDASIQTIVAELKADPDPGMVLLALTQPQAQAFLLASRRAGVTPPEIGLQTIGYGDFADLFEDEPEERETPGFFTDGLYVASPLLYDALGGATAQFADRFRARYDTSPEWFGAKTYDAVTVAARAIDIADPGDGDVATGRSAVRDALAGMDRPGAGVDGLGGPLFFPEGNDVPQALLIGRFAGGNLASAPTQYRVVVTPEQFDLDADRAAGRLLEVGPRMFRQYRVVYIGLDLNEVSELSTTGQTFGADFSLWFRYQGDPSATDIVFTNATDPTLSPGEPISTREVNGEQFAMYRVKGTFAQPLDFHDYPWDVHELTIGLVNRLLDENDIVYVADESILRQSQAERLQSGFDLRQPFNKIPNWEATRVFFSLDEQTSRSAVPDEETGAPTYVQLSAFEVEMTFSRDVRSFLIKNLLPLALLALVTYISLFFSADQAGSRIGFAITSLLTSSVLLSSVSGQLPDIGYTVAIEWGFYAYLALSGLLVFYNIVIERLYKQKRYAAVRRIDTAARILYPVIIGAVVAAYVVEYA